MHRFPRCIRAYCLVMDDAALIYYSDVFGTVNIHLSYRFG